MKINLVKTMVDKKSYTFNLVDNTVRIFDEPITLKNFGITFVKFTSGDVERGTIELKSNIDVENFNNGWKERIIYSFFH